MKKKILAVICAMTMVMGMSLSVCAAGSNNASSAAEEATEEEVSYSPADAAEVVVDAAATGNTTGQKFTGATIEAFAKTTTVTAGPTGASVSVLPLASAKAVIAEANKVVGNSAFIASVVELNGGAGTYTLKCDNVWKGQKVTIIHQKADGSFESIQPSSVENNSVTFSLTSTSPVAIVVDAAAPKTGDAIAMAAVLAFAGMGGAAFFGKKAKN